MKQIKLSNGMICKVDDRDYDGLSQYRWHLLSSRNKKYAYRSTKNKGVQKNVLMHRQITGARKGEIVDHIDGYGLNNQRKNIRKTSHSINSQNSKGQRGKTSKYKGVSLHRSKGLFRAVIKVNGKSKHIGYFKDQVQAAHAYDRVARENFGANGRFNFPKHNERTAI